MAQPELRALVIEAQIPTVYPPVQLRGLVIEASPQALPPPPSPTNDSSGGGAPGGRVEEELGFNDYTVAREAALGAAFGATYDLGGTCSTIDVFATGGDAQVKVYGVDGTTVVALITVPKNGFRSIETQGRYVQMRYVNDAGAGEVVGFYRSE